MSDILCIYVLWHHQSPDSAALADRISGHFDGLGMERDGVQYRVPVRFRSQPWRSGPAPDAPRPIDLTGAEHNAVVLLHDDVLAADRPIWDAYVRDIASAISSRGDRDLLIPFQRTKTASLLPSISDVQHGRHYAWVTTLPDDEARLKRLLLHILNCVRSHLRAYYDPSAPPEPLFVSHAKADGDDTARAIVDHVNNSTNDVPLNTFYDAMELKPGEKFQKRFQREISHGTLLAIISDIYDSRPWCVYELTLAKRKLRPIVLADVGKLRTSRTYPYGANLPRVRLTRVDVSAIEALLVETLSEGLRCDLFAREAAALVASKGLSGAVGLPRPPELFDIIDGDTAGRLLIYPDPPVPDIERQLLDKAAARLTPPPDIKTIGELR